MERTALGQVAERGVQLAVQVCAAGCQHRPADARAVYVRRQHDLRKQSGGLNIRDVTLGCTILLHTYIAEDMQQKQSVRHDSWLCRH